MTPPGQQPYLEQDVIAYLTERLAQAELSGATSQARADHAHRLLEQTEQRLAEALAVSPGMQEPA